MTDTNFMEDAPPDGQSQERPRRLLRMLSLPFQSLPLPSRDTTADATIELDLLEPPPQPHANFVRRRTAPTTTTPPPQDHTATPLPWPSLTVTHPSRDYNSGRNSIDSLRSEASSLSTLSESEPRGRRATRPKPARPALREAKSEAIWREHWI